jgi:hypothetical protein
MYLKQIYVMYYMCFQNNCMKFILNFKKPELLQHNPLFLKNHSCNVHLKHSSAISIINSFFHKVRKILFAVSVGQFIWGHSSSMKNALPT